MQRCPPFFNCSSLYWINVLCWFIPHHWKICHHDNSQIYSYWLMWLELLAIWYSSTCLSRFWISWRWRHSATPISWRAWYSVSLSSLVFSKYPAQLHTTRRCQGQLSGVNFVLVSSSETSERVAGNILQDFQCSRWYQLTTEGTRYRYLYLFQKPEK